MNRSTSTQPHLYAAITFHGYGHIAQTAAIIREMRKRFPQLKLTIQTSAPRPVLDRHIGGDFIHVNRPTDVGMVMQNALEVLVDKSAEAYRNFHTDWHEKIHREAEILAGYSPDVIFANVPYLTLAAASRARIPAIALCSLNWADIYGHYCREYKETEAIRQEILEAYNGCDLFLRPQPSMPMTDLSNTLSIDPIAKIGQDRRAEIKEILGLEEHEKLVLIALGGINTPLSMHQWPRLPGIRWLVQSDWHIKHPDAFIWEKLGMSIVDVLKSCDAIITKPGYGTFTEAVCNGVPVLYVRRFDWPEEKALIDWLNQYGVSMEISRDDLNLGAVLPQLQQLFETTNPTPPAATGAIEAADILQKYL